MNKEVVPDAGGMSSFARGVYEGKYAWKDDEGNVVEDWSDTAFRVVSNVMDAIGMGDSPEADRLFELVSQRKFIPGGRYLYASGRPLHQTQNCLLMRADDSREGWATLMHNAGMALQTGAGIGIDYSDVRASGEPIRKTGGVASGPLSLMNIINEIGRNVMQGGSRRSAIWAGLNWKHKDIFKFITVKDWPEVVVREKEKDFTFPAALDMTNISVLLDDDFFVAYEDFNHPLHSHATDVYDMATRQMIKTAEPGFSVDIGENAGETLRNACTEVTSRDDSDVCNLGSINMARIESVEEMAEVTKLGTLFLLAGTVYSHLPYEKVHETRQKNRRLGLGVMGIHEWLLARGKTYGPDLELGAWLDEYAKSGEYANGFADALSLTRPVKTRAIAPTGTIGIVAETTTGIEPIFCAAYKRRIRSASPDGDITRYEYVVDPTARRLLDSGVPVDSIEDAYSLSYNVERRIKFQAWVQQWVDHGISSTINLPYPITHDTEVQDFKQVLMHYLPRLRGVTCYPDGARSGQPLTVAALDVAIAQEGVVFEELEERCVGGACGV
jgi:ribonucleoside-diphosphate reductase alpha chain